MCISRFESPPEYSGPLEINELLGASERLFENKLVGPETLVFHKGKTFRPYMYNDL